MPQDLIDDNIGSGNNLVPLGKQQYWCSSMKPYDITLGKCVNCQSATIYQGSCPPLWMIMFSSPQNVPADAPSLSQAKSG